MGTLVCVHTGGIVDTLEQSPPMSAAKKQRRRTIKERRDIVEETLVPWGVGYVSSLAALAFM